MLNVRKTWMVALSLALAAFCSAPLSAAPLLGTKGAGDDADKWLLNNPEVVMTINIKQMLASELVKGELPAFKAHLQKSEEAKTLFQAIGLDPLKDVDSILISAAGGSAKDAKALVVVKGRFDTDKIHKVLAKESEKKDKVEAVKEGGQQLYLIKVQEDRTLCAGFASKSILVLTENKESTIEAMKNGGTKTAKIGKDMKSALSKFTGKEGITFAMVITDEIKKAIDRAPPQAKVAAKLQALTASVTVTDSVDLNITGHTSEPKAAKQLASTLASVKVVAGGFTEDYPVVGKILDELKINAEKDGVVIALKITKAMIDEARKLGGAK